MLDPVTASGNSRKDAIFAKIYLKLHYYIFVRLKIFCKHKN
jgi:hypothetical protein